MPNKSDRLADAVRFVIDEAQRLTSDDFEAALDRVADEIATGERDDDLYQESIIDGIRWGVRAAVCVEFGGGTILRVLSPGGVRITHEWLGKPQSDLGRASILNTVKVAMGDV